MPAKLEQYDFALAVATLGNFRQQLQSWIRYYNSQSETSITIRDPRNILDQLYTIDQAYRKLLIETGRIN